MRLVRILLVLSILISAAGCATTQALPTRPTKPVITAMEHEGMVCFSEDDAYLLYLYIIDLEDGYEN